MLKAVIVNFGENSLRFLETWERGKEKSCREIRKDTFECARIIKEGDLRGGGGFFKSHFSLLTFQLTTVLSAQRTFRLYLKQ